jgi:ACT domain
VLLVRQQDKPGIIAAVSAILGRESVNISFMTVRARKLLSSLGQPGVCTSRDHAQLRTSACAVAPWH